jgi:hypothetical protein
VSDTVIVYRSRPYLSTRTTNVVPQTSSETGGAIAWDPLNKHEAIILSNSDLTATLGGGASVQGRLVRSLTSHITGKWFVEITYDEDAGALLEGFGIVNANVVFNDTVYLGEDTNSLGYWADGNFYYNNGVVDASQAIAQGDILQLSIDLDNRQFWARHNAASNWNNDAGANPATNTGGYALAGNLTTGAIWVAFESANATGACTLTAAAGSPPAGFSAW